jgi:starvation-inducible outer membrane lipoprotein
MACLKAKLALLCASALLLVACQSTPSAPVPAHLVAHKTNAACIAQMQTAATRPGGKRVVLTPTAFAAEDHLSIASTDPLDGAGLPRSGRLRDVPDSYRLTLNNGSCTMTREQGGQTTVLSACTCVAMP